MIMAAGMTATHAAPLPQDQQLQDRYKVPASRFMEIDGTSVHYADEGSGPTIVLIHGSFSSLRQWNGWAEKLRKHYRVVRFDLPPAGLSGASPTADYGIDAKLHVLDQVLKRLDVTRFLLVSTSSGSVTAAAYAAQHPERLSGMIISNATVGHLQIDASDFPPALAAAVARDATHKSYHEDELWRQVMLYHFENDARVTPALVHEWTELNNRALALPPAAPGKSGVTHDRTPADLEKITAPTLLLWADHDKEAPVEKDGRKGLELLASKDKQLIVVPRCGHVMPLDCGKEALALAMPFIRRVAN